ncbi:MAG: lipocalin family protein [Candidatus Kerfeldbacteria bacterium]
MKKVLFPRDENKHDDAIIEWWYFNGHLWDKRGSRYAYMSTLFKVDTRHVGEPMLKRMPFKTLYFAHSQLFNVAKRSFAPIMEYIVIPSRDSFTRDLLFVNFASPFVMNGYFNNSIEETSLFNYRVKNEQVNLSLESKKKPLMVGGDGYQRLGNKGSYYYTLTHLDTKGTIRQNDRDLEVTGLSWMDHQWSKLNFASSRQWTWFSLQLDNGTEILCYIYGDDERDDCWASIMNPNGTQTHTSDVHFTALDEKWKSPKTKATYSISWKISIPSKKINITVKPLRKDPEMLFAKVNYWEGPMDVRGTVGSKEVNGHGFMEIFGRPSQYNEITALKGLVSDYANGLKTQLARLPGGLKR